MGWHIVSDTLSELRDATGAVLGEILKLRIGGYKWSVRRRPAEDPKYAGHADTFGGAKFEADQAWQAIQREAKAA